ncbi:hypothetical protein PAXRUDRAFT_41021, partial [Paxillus rubicundulus Ve08.2h10]
LESLASCLESKHKITDMTPEEKNVLNLLKHVNTISACILGSKASYFFICNEIYSYFGYFDLPHLFFTFNPSIAHSSIFQVM